ncbi:MAG: TetR/AcrR family transcriptional regulator [Elusimicrobiota bacterium]|jgi:AcrR family transcriptional regulator
MARPHAEHPELRRRRILDAARVVMARQDYRDLRLEDVAREAGLAKGTLYLYFRDKTDLMCAVLDDMLHGMEDLVRDATPKTPAPSAREAARTTLRAIAEGHLAFLDVHHDFMTRCISQDPLLSEDPSYAPIRTRMNAHLTMLTKLIREAQSAGLMRPGDPRMDALFFMELLRLFLTRRVVFGNRRPLRTQADALLDLFLNGTGRHA